MDELKKTTWTAALAIGAAVIMLFICIFRVSNVITLVIIVNMAVLAAFSVVSSSKLRYALLALLIGVLALALWLRQEGSTLLMVSILARFFIAGLLLTYFANLLTGASHKIYIDMRRLAAEREEASRQSQMWLGRLTALVGVISAISSKSTLRDIFTESLEEARKVFNADSGLIYSVGAKTGKMSIISSFGYSPELLEKMKNRWAGHTSTCQACTRMKTIAVDNLAADEKCQNLAKVNTGSSICLPIASGNNLWGVLHLRRKHPDAFTAEDVMLAQSMAYQFALAMQRANLFDQVNLLAITDPLTGLYNYRKLTRDLEKETVRSRRYDHPFSFIMADIDHFKAFNDLYGHQAGDEVLREVARSLDGGRREVDRVYRYGGEEFSILLPETDWRESLEVAEKLRKRVESLTVELEGRSEPLRVTVSMGVASFPHDAQDWETITAAADEALYRAKETGRNRAVAHMNTEKAAGIRKHHEGSLGSIPR